MKHVIKTITAAAMLAALSQASFGQYGTHGQLNLNSLPGGGGLSGEYGTAGIYFAGLVSLTYTPSTGVNAGHSTTYAGYCTVLDVEVNFGATWGATQLLTSDFVPQPPADLVNDNQNYDLLYGGHGAAADQIVGGEQAYVADHFSGNDLQNAAAQIAIWDLEQGGNGTANDGFFGNAGGGFAGTGVESSWTFGGGLTSTINALAMADAASAYNGGHGAENSGSDIWFKADLNGQGVPVSQDFLVPSGSPEPFTLAIGAAGIGIALRRRFARKAKN